MNGVYRSIWSDSAGTFVAVSENTKSAGKKSSPVSTAVAGGQHVFLQVLTVALMLVYGTNGAAQPLGGVVSAGGASISSGATGMTIIQSTPSAVINWQSFNIGAQESVRFIQPSSSAVMLNRVLSANPSNILGHLSANGKVFLVNPNGILFGKGAQLNVGGLVASMLNITDGDFMAGRYIFSGTSAGAILNQGSINAAAGYVALLGANVSNEGIITANMGSVALAAGNAITLDLAGDGLLNVTVTQGAVNALIQNGGLIQADGGQVLLTTQAAGNLLQSVVNNTGVIQAQSIHNHNGTIKLLGDIKSGTVNVGGTLDVSGTGPGQTGGSVTATGHHVGLFGGHVNASGDAGGGTVLIGGDYQGKNPKVQNAAATYMSADATISADAITTGSGGKVVLWADDATRAYGSITARGGSQGGDGGLIETSGHWLDVAGIKVNAGAPSGKNGTWLLDPANVTISGAADSNGSYNGGAPNVFSPISSATAANVDAASLVVTLNGGANVTVTTTNNGSPGGAVGDITVNSALTWTTANTLTLLAAHDVIVNAAMVATASTSVGSGIVLTAGNDVLINAAMTASSDNSAIRLTAGHDVIAGFAITASAINTVINMSAGNNVTSTSTVTATGSGAKIDMIAGGNGNVSVNTVTASGGGSMNLRANKDVIVSGTLTSDTVSGTSPVILIADNDGTGPGVAGGTVRFTGAGVQVVTPQTSIRFNPVNYGVTTTAEIAAYALKVSNILDARAWVFALGTDKIYDRLRNATVNTLKPDLSAALPPVTLTTVGALFDTKDVVLPVGTTKLITFDSYTLTGSVDYALFAPFTIIPVTSGTARAVITPKALTGSVAAGSSVYGAALAPGAASLTGVVSGDIVTPAVVVVDTSGQLSTSSHLIAGSHLGIESVSATLSGADADNYTFAGAVGDYTVSQLAIIGNITAANKSYDGNTSATITGRVLTDAIGGDAVSYSGGTATFSDKNVANGKTVTGIGLALAGADAGNYTVNPTDTTTANITPAPLTVKANDASKVYGQTFTPAGTAFTTPVAPQNGETVGSITATSLGSPATASVASYTIIPSNATGGSFIASNYTIDYVSGVLTVLPLVPPISTETISDVVAAEEMLGDVPTIIQDMIPGVNLAWMPTVVLATMPAELLSVVPVIVPAEVLLDDPVAVPVELPVVVLDPAPVPVQIDDPVLAPQNIYRTPFHLPKQDRN